MQHTGKHVFRVFALFAFGLSTKANCLRSKSPNPAAHVANKSASIQPQNSAHVANKSASIQPQNFSTTVQPKVQEWQKVGARSNSTTLNQWSFLEKPRVLFGLASKLRKSWDALVVGDALITTIVMVVGVSTMVFTVFTTWFYWKSSHLIERLVNDDNIAGVDCETITARDEGGTMDVECSPQTANRLQARVCFLLVGFCNSAFTLLAGITIYFITNSLTVKVDFISTMSDGLSSAINIAVEYLKRHITKDKYVLALDILGTFMSLACLVGATTLNLMGVVARVSLPSWGTGIARVAHLEYMVFYCIFGTSLDAFTLRCWWRLRKAMAPPGQPNSDWLNVASALVRVVIGFIRNLSVMCTVCWMVYLSTKHVPEMQELAERSRGDVAGSLFICGCVLVSLALLLHESLQTFSKICGNGGCCSDTSDCTYASYDY